MSVRAGGTQVGPHLCRLFHSQVLDESIILNDLILCFLTRRVTDCKMLESAREVSRDFRINSASSYVVLLVFLRQMNNRGLAQLITQGPQ